MIEKTSKDIKCVICGAPAVIAIGDNAFCEECKDSEEAQEAKELIDIFED